MVKATWLVAAFTLLAIATVGVDSHFNTMKAEREFMVHIVDPNDSLISYKCNFEVELKEGYNDNIEIAELTNRLVDDVEIEYVSYHWVSGGDGVELVDAYPTPLPLDPGESGKISGTFYVDDGKDGLLYLVFEAYWVNGSAQISTEFCPVKVTIVDEESACAIPDSCKCHHNCCKKDDRWCDRNGRNGLCESRCGDCDHHNSCKCWKNAAGKCTGWCRYFYYDGNDMEVPVYAGKHNLVGYLNISTSGDETEFCYNLYYTIGEVHLYFDESEPPSNAWGLFPIKAENVGSTEYCVTADGSEGWVAAHATVFLN